MNWTRLQSLVQRQALSVFGEPATYTPVGSSSPLEIRVTFDSLYQSVDPETRVAIEMEDPHVGVKLSDLSQDPRHSDVIAVRGKVYKVRRIEPDGQGMAKLFLEEQ